MTLVLAGESRNVAWHGISVDRAAGLLETDAEKGLSAEQVGKRRERFGPNLLSRETREPPWVRFFAQVNQPLVWILIGAGAIMAAFGGWVDSGVILGVVLVNAIIGFLQETKALGAIQALAKTLANRARVVRDGVEVAVPASELVPGDLVVFNAGDKLAADLRLVFAKGLRIDESSLTGEAVAVDKNTEPVPEATALADRINLAFAATLAVHGQGRGLVTAIGDETEIGNISRLVAATQLLDTPLTRKMARFSRYLLVLILALTAVTFLLGLLRGAPWLDMLSAAVALAVGAIPEGLPAALTITLAIGASRMARRRAIIRRLPAVETLGGTTVICSDKTGTLTQNQMTVKEIVTDSEVFTISGTGYAPEGAFFSSGRKVEPLQIPSLLECLKAGLLCNDASLTCDDEGWCIRGDPTEGALVAVAVKAGLAPDRLRSEAPLLDSLPFDSEKRYMVTLHKTGTQTTAFFKGSSEALLPLCRDSLGADGVLVDLDRRRLSDLHQDMTNRALRVLTVARLTLPAEKMELSHDESLEGLTFLGFQGMIDPPRPEALSAVEACREAGIGIKMITGDHPGTAAAIARQFGIIPGSDGGDTDSVLLGQVLATLSDSELEEKIEKVGVFARMAPEQKLKLVRSLQARNQIVAMTGDGVNDAPALRQSDIGIAMGRGGTEVAREAADMVLSDDNFASIKAAVEEGRTVFDNLIKFLTWTLPTNIGMGLVVMAAVVSGSSLPIIPVQILWINMTTVVLLGLALAFEPPEADIMKRAPRDPRTPVLGRPLVFRIVLVGALLLAGAFGLYQLALSHGRSEQQASTIAANVFVTAELFYLFNCRSLSRSAMAIGLWRNPWVWVGSVLMVLLQLLFTYAPFMNRLFRTMPIGWFDWALVVAVGMAMFLVIGIEKRLRYGSDRASTRTS